MSNTTTITGNLTREPEIRYTKEGQATAQLGVAVNRRWQDRTTQEWQEATSFFDVVCWRDLAENVALSLSKGMRVVVTGRIEQRSWETDEGEHRSKVEIVADEIGPMPALRHRRRAADRASPGAPSQPPSQERTSFSRRPHPAAHRLAGGLPGTGTDWLQRRRSQLADVALHAPRSRHTAGTSAPVAAEEHAARTLTIRTNVNSPHLPAPLPTHSSPRTSPNQTTTFSARPSATSVCFTRVAFEGEPALCTEGEGPMMVVRPSERCGTRGVPGAGART